MADNDNNFEKQCIDGITEIRIVDSENEVGKESKTDEGENTEREITQTDHLNKRLLKSFLDRLNQVPAGSETSISEIGPDQQGHNVVVPQEESNGWNSDTCKLALERFHKKSTGKELVDQAVRVMNGTTLNNNNVLRKSKSCVVGVSGVTNGGKTSLCRRLQPAFPNCTVLNMDDYYWPDHSTNHVRAPGFQFNNYEVPSSVDFKRLTEDLLTWIGEHQCGDKKHILLVEGILIFNYKPLEPYFDKKYFLTLDYEECSQRRRFRGYDPPDPPGYFDRICWPWYLKNKEDLAEQKDIVFLDGNQGQEKTFQRVLKEIRTFMHY